MSTNKRMDKQVVVHPYNELLLGNKKKQTIDKCNDMDGSPKYYVE